MRVLPPEEIHARLARQAPPGLDILSVRRIDSARSTLRCAGSPIALPVPADRLPDLSRPHRRRAGRAASAGSIVIGRIRARPDADSMCVRSSWT